MKDLRGEAAAQVPASSSECFELLTAIERYPEWHPDVVRRAEVVRRDAQGWPVLANATVYLGIGPVRREFGLQLDVATVPGTSVRLTRVPHDPSDGEELMLTWQIGPGPTPRLGIELHARIEVPRFLPLQGVGDSVAQGFVTAARAELERRGGG